MSNDLQKYENWRAITESDYVTMFIKTWFTYISVLRNTYPDVNVFTEDGKPRGDKPFLNRFKEEVLPHIRKEIKVESFYKLIFEMYPHCIKKVFITFPQYFFQTFYRYNENYHYHNEDKTSNAKWILDIKTEDRVKLRFCLLLFGSFRGKPYNESIKITLDLKSFIYATNESLSIDFFDEYTYLKALYSLVCDNINEKLSQFLETIEKDKKYNSSIRLLLRQGCEKTSAALNFSFEPNYRKMNEISNSYPENSRVIFKQMPFQLFYKTYLDNVYIQNREYYDSLLLKNGLDWFSEFVYQLRNALFHEIIDPLDEEWQLIYKNAYLLLKEIVDYTTNYSILKEVQNFIESTYIEVENEELDEKIETSTESEAFVLNDYELIDDDIEITHIEVEDVDLIDNSVCLINKQEAKFKCIVNLSIDGRAKVFDDNQSIYDREDDKYYFIVHDEVKFRNANAKIEIETEIGYDLRDIANTANIVDVNIKDRMIIVNLSNDESDTDWISIFPNEDGVI